jgi:prevent-host-death family protein
MMARAANIHEAKSQLSKLVEAALAGEDVVIQRAGKPAVRLVPYDAKSKPRSPGAWKGKVRMAADFEATASGGEPQRGGDGGTAS